MKQLTVLMFAVIILAGCKDRVIWDDSGKLEGAAQDREIWDSKGKIDTGDRKIWNDQNNKPVVE